MGTTVTDIANRALQKIGTRSSVTDAELAGNSTNEAIQINLCLENLRDDILRMAPWNCALRTANLVYITSTPGTPENTSGPTTLWQPGQPSPPWAYEYQYPADCLRACWIIPATQTGYAGGVPITTAVTGGAPSFWQGPPVRFKVQTDQFVPVLTAVLAVGGSGFAVGDFVTMVTGVNTAPPIGAPVQVVVETVDGSGAILTCTVISQVDSSDPPKGGSYFAKQTNPVAMGVTTGAGSGATFNLTYGTVGPQRVVLTNQEFATLVYCQRVTDPDVMDTLFQSAWSSAIASTICQALTGDKKLSEMMLRDANADIMQARNSDGNEGLLINDVTPDWIRIRGIDFPNAMYSGPYSAFDWGGLLT